MKTSTIRTITLTLFGLAALTAAPTVQAQHSLEMKTVFEILSFDETKDYGPMTNQIIEAFQDEIGDTQGHEQLQFERGGSSILIDVKVKREDALTLKDKLKALVLDITSGTLKNQVSVRELEMRVSRAQNRQEKRNKKRVRKARKSGKNGKTARTDVPATEIEEEYELEEELASDDEKGARGPGGVSRTLTIRFGDKQDGKWRVSTAHVVDYPLITVFAMVSKIAGTDVSIRPEAAYAPVNVSMSDVDLESFLAAVCDSARVDLKRKDGYMVIGRDLE